ncbi:MAG: hypothetical protein ACRDG4_11240, partial [Chloroflexota bacterium]
GMVAQVATGLGRQFIGCELNPKYLELHDLRRTTLRMPLGQPKLPLHIVERSAFTHPARRLS